MNETDSSTDQFSVLGNMLREYRIQHQDNFTGIAYTSVQDMQQMTDEFARMEAQKYNRPLGRRRVVGHGDQGRMLGVRVVADKNVAVGMFDLRPY